MKKEKAYVGVLINDNGQLRQIILSTDYLKQVLQSVGKGKANEEEVDFSINCGNKDLQISLKISDLKRLIKQSEMCKDMVPKHLNGVIVDLTQKIAKKMIAPISCRDDEIEKIWFYLSQRTKSNAFIIGDTDVGKTALAKEITRQITTNECPKQFYKKRVLLLRPEKLITIEKERVFKREVQKVFDFIVEHKDEIVLYIDNAIYMKTDALLIAWLYALVKKHKIPMMMTASIEDYEDYFLGDFNISKYLNSVIVNEPEYEELPKIIAPHVELFKKKYKVDITEDIINYCIYTSHLCDTVSLNPGNTINILEKAFMEARRKGKKLVDKECILNCYSPDAKRFRNLPEDTIRTTAYHETGHYIVEKYSEYAKDIKVSCVSILPTDWYEGVTCSFYDEKEYAVHSKDYFSDRIASMLGGRVAEQKFTGLYSAGASCDLEHANNCARAMIMNWGFSGTLGNKNRQYDFSTYFLIPESKKEMIDKDVEEIILEATNKAEMIINEKEELLKIIAERLMKDEVLTGKQLEEICKEYEESKKTE